ncbi:MAG: hypothetical protein QW775_05490 [Ignisphaera sp.]
MLITISNDQVKHHRVLTSIRDNIGVEYVVNEEDMWNAILSDNPWHGISGG